MAVIIPLHSARRSLSRTAPVEGRSAEIMFFTGVRYERPGNKQPAPSRQAELRRRPARPRKPVKQQA